VPKLDEVKDKVRDAVIAQKARELEPPEGRRDCGQAEGGAGFRQAAKRGRRSEVHDFIAPRSADSGPWRRAGGPRTRRSRWRAGTVSDAIVKDTGAAIIKVLEKADRDAGGMGVSQARFREEVLSERATASSPPTWRRPNRR